ncbi:MAG TPA: hypothetical protein VK511_04550 [Gemmatimonadaceae bacterium]|nr:hypothetical protein [Gemmatimonadaceae bacterium]
MIDPDVISFAVVMTVIVGSLASLALVYVGTKWAIAATSRRELKSSTLSDSRLEQIQQSIDSIAIEVERITEAQRFTAKLMAERAEERLPR